MMAVRPSVEAAARELAAHKANCNACYNRRCLTGPRLAEALKKAKSRR